jgi:hypothetical protein
MVSLLPQRPQIVCWYPRRADEKRVQRRRSSDSLATLTLRQAQELAYKRKHG